MSCYFKSAVPVPSGKGISLKKIKGTVYVYYAYMWEDTGNGNLKPRNCSIGKLIPDTDPPEMYPNLSYYLYGEEAGWTEPAAERMNSRPGPASRTPETKPPGSGPTKTGLEAREERLLTGFSLIMDFYRELAQDIRSAGGDVSELNERISRLLEPEWTRNLK